jgi:hypothetical protein
MIRDSPFLPHKLIEAMICHDASAPGICVYSMILSGLLSVNGDPETDRLRVGSRAEHKMKVPGVEMKYDPSTGGIENGALHVFDAPAIECPFVQRRLKRRGIALL